MIGISPTFSMQLHPNGNSLVERSIQNVKNCLHHAMNKFGRKWTSFFTVHNMGVK